jgi:hypothetical protein
MKSLITSSRMIRHHADPLAEDPLHPKVTRNGHEQLMKPRTGDF